MAVQIVARSRIVVEGNVAVEGREAERSRSVACIQPDLAAAAAGRR
ncbi:MAG: hypothetical protein ACXVYV_01560 [Gaiellales bacterium]